MYKILSNKIFLIISVAVVIGSFLIYKDLRHNSIDFLKDIEKNDVFLSWINKKGLKADSFKVDTLQTETIEPESSALTACDTSVGGRLFVSPNAKSKVCLYSGSEPDSRVYLINKGDKSSKILASCGTPCSYEDGFWLNDSEFVLLWTLSDYEYENDMKPFYKLYIDRYNTTNYTVTSITTDNLYK